MARFMAETAQKSGAAIAALVLVATPVAMAFEGVRTHPYRDVTGTPTVCYGDTEVAMRVYGRDECAALLRARLAKDYAPHLIQCVPALAKPENRYRGGALLDASYNAGWQGACRSPMARDFNAGKWTEGCNAFVGWRETSKGVHLAGLARRRRAEADVCRRAA
jgi:lysozyme